MRLGTRQRAILDMLRDGDDLRNDAGMWSVGQAGEDGVRVQADPCLRLFARGYIYCTRVQAGMGYYGSDRAVYQLTEKGKRA